MSLKTQSNIVLINIEQYTLYIRSLQRMKRERNWEPERVDVEGAAAVETAICSEGDQKTLTSLTCGMQ